MEARRGGDGLRAVWQRVASVPEARRRRAGPSETTLGDGGAATVGVPTGVLCVVIAVRRRARHVGDLAVIGYVRLGGKGEPGWQARDGDRARIRGTACAFCGPESPRAMEATISLRNGTGCAFCALRGARLTGAPTTAASPATASPFLDCGTGQTDRFVGLSSIPSTSGFMHNLPTAACMRARGLPSGGVRRGPARLQSPIPLTLPSAPGWRSMLSPGAPTRGSYTRAANARIWSISRPT